MTRKEILEKLSAGQITRADAEQQLAALGSPVPQELPLPPQDSRSGMSKGCLIALLAGIIFIALMMFLLVALFTFRATAGPMEFHGEQLHMSPSMDRAITQEAIESGMFPPGSEIEIHMDKQPAEALLPAEEESR